MTINLDMQNVLVLKRMYELRNVRLVAESLGKTSGAISKNLTKMKGTTGRSSLHSNQKWF